MGAAGNKKPKKAKSKKRGPKYEEDEAMSSSTQKGDIICFPFSVKYENNILYISPIPNRYNNKKISDL